MSSSLAMGSPDGGGSGGIDVGSTGSDTATASGKSMSPASIAFMGVGTWMSGMAKSNADEAQANAERTNAGFYREEAAFAQATGDRQLLLFDRQSKVTYGEQGSAFAKAGVDTAESSRYLAQQKVFGSQQEGAINAETNMNVTLANARANQADQEASNLDNASGTDQTSAIIGTAATIAMLL